MIKVVFIMFVVVAMLQADDEQEKYKACQKTYVKCIAGCRGAVPCSNQCTTEMEDCTGYEKGTPKPV